MSAIPRLSIRQSPQGAVLCLSGKWQKRFGTFPEVENIVGLELSTIAGECESDLEFISELPPIQHFASLFSFPFDYSYLHCVRNLKSVKFITLRGSQLDFAKLQTIESAIVPWQEHCDSVFDCGQLRGLSLFGYRGKSSAKLASLPRLEILKLKDCTLPEVNSLSSLKRLKMVEIGMLPRLTTLAPFSDCDCIEWLRLAKCGKAADFEALQSLRRLRGLVIDIDKKVESISYVESFSALRIFNFAMTVLDGGIKRMLSCPALARSHFADRRNYDMRREELNAILAARKNPLSSDEENGFQLIAKGINDWHVSTSPEIVLAAE